MRALSFIYAGLISACATGASAQDPVGALSFGLGVDEKGEAVAQAFLQTRRAFGQDVFATVRLDASQSTRQAEASLSVPGMFGQNPSIGFDLGITSTKGLGTFAFDQTRAKAEIVATFPETGFGQFEAFYALHYADISGLSASDSALLKVDAGSRTNHGVGYRWALDVGDDDRAQARVTLSQEAMLSSDDRSIFRSELGFSARSAPIGPARLSFGLRAGAVSSSGTGTRVEDRFFLGPSDIRGFALAGIGPRDLAANDAALGGNLFSTARLDLKFPGVVTVASQITPGLFVDAGSLWSLDSVAGGPAGANPVDDGSAIRSSAGISVAWELRAGSLRMDLSQPIQSQSYDNTQNFQLAFQTTF